MGKKKQKSRVLPQSPAEIKKQLEYWQERLGLRDWDIEVKVVEQIDYLNTDGSIGACAVFLKRRKAQVILTDDDDDWVGTLVHELLHIHLEPLEEQVGKNTYLIDIHLEQVIEAIARAFVDYK